MEVEAYTAWVDSLGVEITSLEQFSDPSVFIELLKKVDRGLVADVGASTKNEFLPKLQQFKKLVATMEDWYREVNEQQYEESINLVAVCARNDEGEICKLLKLALILAVICENKEEHINEIMALEENVQTAIMNIIGPEMGEGGGDDTKLYEQDGTEEREFMLEQEIARLLAENEAVKQASENLQVKLDETIKERDELQLESEEPSFEDTFIRHEDHGEQLKDHIAELEYRLRASTEQIHEHEKTIKELSQSIDASGTRKDDLIKELKDQLNDAETQLNRLSKIESIAERYKRKLQDSKDLERHVEYLENETQELKRKLGSATASNVDNHESDGAGSGDKKKDDDDNTEQEPISIEHIEQIRIILETESLDPTLPEQFTNLTTQLEQKRQQVGQLQQELRLVSGAWFALASRIQQQNVAVMKRAYETPKGWLTRQRQALDKIIY